MITYYRLPKEMVHHKESKCIKQLLDEAERGIENWKIEMGNLCINEHRDKYIEI